MFWQNFLVLLVQIEKMSEIWIHRFVLVQVQIRYNLYHSYKILFIKLFSYCFSFNTVVKIFLKKVKNVKCVMLVEWISQLFKKRM